MTRLKQRKHIEMAIFIAVALLFVSGSFKSEFVVGDGVDLYGTIWFYWYAKQSLLTLTDPSWTDLFFFPYGKDIFAHTGNNMVDAYLSIPFQIIFGGVEWVRWWVVAMMVTNAIAFRWFARLFLKSPNAIFAAALAWEVNPFTVFEINCGRFTQAMLLFLPIALGAFIKSSRSREWKWPVLAGLATAAQAWTYWFMGFFMAPALIWIAAVELWRSEDRRDLVKRYAVAGAVCLLVVGPGVYMMASAAHDGLVPGVSIGGERTEDGLRDLSNNVANSLHGYGLFAAQGPPMLTYVAWAVPLLVWFVRGRGRTIWLPIFLVCLLFSIGPVTGIPGIGGRVRMAPYMFLYDHLPFFDRLWFPYRMLVIPFVAASLAVGHLFQGLEGRLQGRGVARPRAIWGVALGAWFALTCFEQSRYALFPFVDRDTTIPASMRWIAEESQDERTEAVFHMPFGVTQPAIIYQTVHGEPLFGGMGENANLLWPDGFKLNLRNSFVNALVTATRRPHRPLNDPPYIEIQRRRFHTMGFRWLVVHRDLLQSEQKSHSQRPPTEEEKQQLGQQAMARVIEILGEPDAVDGPIVVWDLWEQASAPEEIVPREGWFDDLDWPPSVSIAYEQILVNKGRTPNAAPTTAPEGPNRPPPREGGGGQPPPPDGNRPPPIPP